MRRLTAFQLVLAMISISVQARSFLFPYFNLEVIKEPPDIDRISFAVVPDGQYEEFHCRAGLLRTMSNVPYYTSRVSALKSNNISHTISPSR